MLNSVDSPPLSTLPNLPMKITRIDDLHADGGWRNFSFLKISTDAGVVGWSEYNENYGAKGLSAVIRAMSAQLVGRDPRPVEKISAALRAQTRQAPGGLNAQAAAAIENALLDAKAKALNIPVCELLGGPLRDRLRVYWSHCGTYLPEHAHLVGAPPLRAPDDLKTLGARVAQSGITALKCNILRFDKPDSPPQLYMPGFGNGEGHPALNLERETVAALRAQLQNLREGAGPQADIMLDINFNFKTAGQKQLARALEDLNLFWIEIDNYDAKDLAKVRDATAIPVASCENLYGRAQFIPFLENRAVDVAVIDVPWNGLLESAKIAAMCDAYGVNIAPHNYYGHLSTLMSAHLCALAPNFRIMEIDMDDVPWKDDLVTRPPAIENGELIMPQGPGWGADINEEALAAHPPR